jgi:hypothetical protein
MQMYAPTPLIAGTLMGGKQTIDPIRRTLPLTAPSSRAERAEHYDSYRIQDRTIDIVVDRLLEELTW